MESLKNCSNKSLQGGQNILNFSDRNKTVLCVDIGTSSLKAALITEKGRTKAFSRRSLNHSNSSKISSLWLPALSEAVKSFGDKIKTVAGICVSGNGPTVVSQDSTTFLWNEEIPEEYGRERLGTKSLFIPRLLAFRSKFKLAWENSERIFSGPEYLIYVLTGAAFSILPEKRYVEAYWDEAELRRFKIEPEKLPDFVPPSYLAGNTLSEANLMLGLPRPVPVFCGAPDFIVALIGTDTLSPGKICDCAGSSEGLNLCTGIPLYGDDIRTLPAVIGGLWNAGVLFTKSGRRFSEYKKRFEISEKRQATYAELTERCIKNPSCEGYKIMEELAKEVRSGYEILFAAAKKEGIKIADAIRITGGQAKNPAWLQMKANIVEKTFEVCSIPDAELLGDAVLAYKGLGIYKTIQEAASSIVKGGKRYYPRGKP
ncbi:xylulokinase [Treponema parvum]|uniref:xylulokinase n=1 Tax=Treponema parvum TaxID=138851 RepID=UPI001AEC0631|nr:FGGY-family carbohydrate kinase [Treponema parvum]QTQ17172.1 hypothetical protein HXT04_10985 [Treponema parvum]